MVEEPAGAHSLWTLHAGLTSELEVSDGLIYGHTHRARPVLCHQHCSQVLTHVTADKAGRH